MSTDPNDLFEDDEEETPAGDDSQLKQLRARADQASKLEKQLKKLSEEAETLRTFKQEQEGKTRISAAEGLLPPEFKGLADVFAEKVEGDLSKEAADAFLQARGLAPKPEAPTEPPKETPQFNPSLGGDQVPPEKITRQQIDDLFKKDPKRAATLLIQMGREDRIEWNNPEGVAQTLRGADIE